MKKKTKIVLASVAALVVIGAVGGESSETEQVDIENQTLVDAGNKTTENAENQTSENTSSEIQEEKVFAVGETGDINGRKLTITKVEKSSGSDFDKPKNGYEYVVLHLLIENDSKDNLSYNILTSFEMTNSQGQITDPAFTIIDSDTALNSGELAPGGTVTGTIVLEHPINDPSLKFKFKPSLFSNDAINYTIN